MPARDARKGQFEARLLLLVSFGLVAFGLVMVYSATSASAALENGDPAYYVKRQAIYAVLGLALMFVFARFRSQSPRKVAPGLVTITPARLAAAPAPASTANAARRWRTSGPAVVHPS